MDYSTSVSTCLISEELISSRETSSRDHPPQTLDHGHYGAFTNSTHRHTIACEVRQKRSWVEFEPKHSWGPHATRPASSSCIRRTRRRKGQECSRKLNRTQLYMSISMGSRLSYMQIYQTPDHTSPEHHLHPTLFNAMLCHVLCHMQATTDTHPYQPKNRLRT